MHKDRERKSYTPKKDYPQPEVTAADLTEKINKHLTTLVEAIKTGNTERLTAYLAFSSRFHRYSRRNQELIYDQKLEATRVANYSKWKKEGQKGIRILVPKFPKGYKQVVEEEANLAEEGDDHQALHARLIQAVQKEGITYRESVATEGARGYSAGGLIVVRPGQPPGNKSRYTRLRRETRETSKPPGEAD